MEILGVWESDQGLMELRAVAGIVSGEYGSDEGRVVGEFTDARTFEGFWIERGSQKACGEEKDGSLHWGRLQFAFDSAERNSFTATWSYCDTDPGKGGWSGERLL